MADPTFLAPISEEIWELKYRLKTLDGAPVDATLDDTFLRVAEAAAGPEKGGKAKRAAWAKRFHGAISDFGFLPAGRILAGAGTGRAVTLFNCFVLGEIEDDLGAIFDGVKEAALTMQQGGGIGPRGPIGVHEGRLRSGGVPGPAGAAGGSEADRRTVAMWLATMKAEPKKGEGRAEEKKDDAEEKKGSDG